MRVAWSRSRSLASLVLPLALAVAACGPADEADTDAEAPADAPAAAAPEPAMPDTTADAMWAYLQAQDYTAWPMWPGTTALYQGTDPHGMLLTTYVNLPAQGALQAGNTMGLPDGAIVVKENYMPDSTLAAVTVMYQAPGAYNEGAGGWWYLKRNADGSIDAAGAEGTMCQSCHSSAPGGDYLYTPLPGGDGDG